METTIGYIVIFGFGILFAALYLFRKDKKRILPISEQSYSQLIISIYIKKEKSTITEIILELRPKNKAIPISNFYLELTNENHDSETVDIKPLLTTVEKEVTLQPGNIYQFPLLTQPFKIFLGNQNSAYDRFRFVVATPDNKKFKTHTLRMNTRWGLFKTDSGKYN